MFVFSKLQVVPAVTVTHGVPPQVLLLNTDTSTGPHVTPVAVPQVHVEQVGDGASSPDPPEKSLLVDAGHAGGAAAPS